MQKKIFIIIVNWNGIDDTIACLESVYNIDYVNFNVILIDNCSENFPNDELVLKFPNLITIVNDINCGFAEGNNIGIRFAMINGADYFFLLNNDTIVDKNILNNFIDASIAYPDAAIFSAKIYYHSNPNTIWFAGAKWCNERLRFRHIGMNKNDDGSFDKINEIDYACGCALFAKVDVVNNIGLLDSKFFLTYEETDWCYRATKIGLKCMYVPGAKLWHKVSVSFGGANSPLQVYFMTRNKLLWSERHLSAVNFARILFATVKDVFWNPSDFNDSSFVIEKIYLFGKFIFFQITGKDISPICRAKYCGLIDYFFRKFGDCPLKIRNL